MRKFIVLLVVLSIVLGAQALFAQCENQTGFNKASCLANSKISGLAATTPSNGQKPEGLTTSFSDAIHGSKVPAEPQAYESLFKLKRTEDGGIVLQPGAYEAYVEAFSLDPTDKSQAVRMLGYLPAPEKGPRASLVQAVLKSSELHADLKHLDVQILLYAVVGNDPIGNWPAPLQQFAVNLLGPDLAGQMGDGNSSGPGNEAAKKALDKGLGKIRQNPTINADIAKGQSAWQKMDIKSGGFASMGMDILLGSVHKQAKQVDGLPRGTWAQLPDGYYVRYLTDEKGVHLQVLVPEAAASKVFDATQYVAVYGGTPAQRLGLSLRPVQQ